MSSAFDTSAFLDQTTTEQSVKRPPIPAGEYRGIIGELAPRPWVSQSDPTKSGMAFDVPITLDLPGDVAAAVGLTEPTLKVKDSIMLDLTDTVPPAIDYSVGKNAKLRKYRDATGNNVPGKAFSPRQLQGNVVTVKIGHREYPAGSGDLFEDVVGIAAA